jgi:DNA repair protein RecO (recombination protein O)
MPATERVFKTSAVILRRSDFGEADRLITLFTPEHGKLRAIAKGVRRPQARAAGHVELYTVADMVIAHGRDLKIISQAELVEPFLAIHDDLKRIGYASLFAELIDRFSVDEQENKNAYMLLVSGLSWLCEQDIDLALASRYYELRLLDVMGYTPSFFDCVISGDPLQPEDQFYSVTEGGVVSPPYSTGYENLIHLPLPVFKILRHFMRHNWQTVKQLHLTYEQHRLLERILHSTLIYLLEQRLQSVEFLRKISSLPDSS